MTYKLNKQSLSFRTKTYETYKSYTTYSLTEFIRCWDFANPRWDNLPEGFPHFDTSELTTKEEEHLLDAIKTAWIISGGGRKYFYKTFARKAFVGITVIALIILLGRTLTTSLDIGVTRSVSAKTVSTTIENIVVSTMSAIFRK